MKIVENISNEQAGDFYRTFLGGADYSVPRHGGYVLKNLGDCVIGFFPCGMYVIKN